MLSFVAILMKTLVNKYILDLHIFSPQILPLRCSKAAEKKVEPNPAPSSSSSQPVEPIQTGIFILNL